VFGGTTSVPRRHSCYPSRKCHFFFHATHCHHFQTISVTDFFLRLLQSGVRLYAAVSTAERLRCAVVDCPLAFFSTAALMVNRRRALVKHLTSRHPDEKNVVLAQLTAKTSAARSDELHKASTNPGRWKSCDICNVKTSNIARHMASSHVSVKLLLNVSVRVYVFAVINSRR
jgi:hypothetical protein